MKRFISKDKKQITLPVPLGSTIYGFTTTCCDACTFQRELFDKKFPPFKYGSRCNSAMPCHTVFSGTKEYIFSLEKLHVFLKDWGIKYFETEKEARESGLVFTQRHANQMKAMGFKLNEYNRCI